MELELDPPQPRPVVQAVASLLDDGAPAPDPWWQAGLDAALAGAETGVQLEPDGPSAGAMPARGL